MKVNAIYIAKVLLTSGNPTAFFTAVDEMCARLKIPMSAMLDCMYIETGGTFNPAIRNAGGSGATGLIQFMPSTARGLGTTTDALAKMTNIQQLKYVEMYFRNMIKSIGKVPQDFFDVYCCIFYPVWVGKPDTVTLAANAYAGNKSIDLNKDGTITKGEFRAWAKKQLPYNVSMESVKKRPLS